MASASFSVWEYLCSTFVSVLLAYATTLWFSLSRGFWARIPDTPTGLASTITNVSLFLSKYAIHGSDDRAFVTFSKASWCKLFHSNFAFFFVSSLNGAVIVAKSGIYLLV